MISYVKRLQPAPVWIALPVRRREPSVSYPEGHDIPSAGQGSFWYPNEQTDCQQHDPVGIVMKDRADATSAEITV